MLKISLPGKMALRNVTVSTQRRRAAEKIENAMKSLRLRAFCAFALIHRNRNPNKYEAGVP